MEHKRSAFTPITAYIQFNNILKGARNNILMCFQFFIT